MNDLSDLRIVSDRGNPTNKIPIVASSSNEKAFVCPGNINTFADAWKHRENMLKQEIPLFIIAPMI